MRLLNLYLFHGDLCSVQVSTCIWEEKIIIIEANRKTRVVIINKTLQKNLEDI